uniref:Integrase catalytic domain-containing protein n=1 Tax=Panagrolaimus sp. ES5 TaxID=591445 RepID=A0AC34F551_9BILA
MQKLASANDGNKFILVVIDVLSKFVWAIPVKNKGTNEMQKAFDIIFGQMDRLPNMLFSDRGLELDSPAMHRYFAAKKIKKFSSNEGDQKAAVVERMIRTLKGRLFRYLNEHGTKRYVDILSSIILGINQTVSRVTKMRAIDITDENSGEVFERVFAPSLLAKRDKPKFVEGSTVRLRFIFSLIFLMFLVSVDFDKINFRLFFENKVVTKVIENPSESEQAKPPEELKDKDKSIIVPATSQKLETTPESALRDPRLDPQSVDKIPDSIDFFNAKPTIVAYQHSSSVEYLPLTPIGTWPLHFRVNSGQAYLDLSRCYLVTSFRITKKDGDKNVPITAADPVSFINGFGATFIKNLKVSFNGRQVYNSNDLFAFNAYLRRRLCIGATKNEEELQVGGYIEDGLNHMAGPGFEGRRALFENDATFETVCSLDVDIFRQKTLLLNEMTIDIEITPHNNFFTLLSTGKAEYQYHLVDCKFYAKQHLLLPQLDLAIQEKLNANAVAKYSFSRNIMKNFFVSPGRYDFNASLFTDYVPKRVFAALVDSKAFNGHIGMSPFEFQPFNLESIRLISNGCHTPAYSYKNNWQKKQFGRAFKDLLDATRTTHGINAQKFLTNSCIYGFDLQAYPNDQYIELQQVGSTMISLNFSVPVPVGGLQLVVYSEFDSIIALDKTRTITTAMAI